MNRILIIAKNTYRQAIRDRILYGILIFALLFLGSTIVLGSLSLGEDLFVVRNFGIAGIYVFSLIITIFMGSSLIYDEIQKKTTYLILSKPVTRGEVILGKFLGLFGAICLTIGLMALAYLAVVYISSNSLDYWALTAIFLQLFEMAILISVIIFFSIITTPLAATIYTILVLYIGHFLSLAIEYAMKADGFSKIALQAAYYIMPNLEKFNVRNFVVHDMSIAPLSIFLPILYAILYTSLMLYLSSKLFDKKEL